MVPIADTTTAMATAASALAAALIPAQADGRSVAVNRVTATRRRAGGRAAGLVAVAKLKKP